MKLDLDLWLRPEDVEPEGQVIFTDEGKTLLPDETGFKSSVYEIGVKLANGEPRRWTMNKTSQRAVAHIYGIDTKSWIGKMVNLESKNVNVAGKDRKGIFVKNVFEAPKPQGLLP